MSRTQANCAVFAILGLVSNLAFGDEPATTDPDWADRPIAYERIDLVSELPIALVEQSELGLGDEQLSLDALLSEVERRNPSLESAYHAWQAALAKFPQVTALADPMISYSVAPLTLDRPNVSRGSTSSDIAISRGTPPMLSLMPVTLGDGTMAQRLGLTGGSPPSASFSLSKTDDKGRTVGFQSSPVPTLTLSDGEPDSRIDIGQTITISQAFPWPGKRRLRGRIALAEAEGARADIETVRQGLIREATVAFYEYWYVQRALEVNCINQDLLSEFQDIAESKYAAGTVSKQDALQAEVEREHLVHQDIVLNRMRAVTMARLNRLLNRTPDAPLPNPPTGVDEPGSPADLDGLLDTALRNRPELHAFEARIDAKELNIDLARKEYRPDFDVMATYDSMWDSDEHRFMVGASANIPIRLGKRRGAVSEAQSERARLESELANKAATVAFEVKEAYEVLNESHHVVQLYVHRLLPAAEENFEAAESGYAAAEVDFLALITAQKLLMDTQLKHYEAQAEYHQAAADLEVAVGGHRGTDSTGSEAHMP